MKKRLIYIASIVALIVIGLITYSYFSNIVFYEYSIYNLKKLNDNELQNKRFKGYNLTVYATSKKKYKLLKYLLKRRLTPFNDGAVAFGISVKRKDYISLELFLKYAKDNNINPFDFYIALGPWDKNSLDVIQYLEKHGLDFSKRSEFGNQLGVFALQTEADNIRDYVAKKCHKFANIPINHYWLIVYLVNANDKSVKLLLENGVEKNLCTELVYGNSENSMKYIKNQTDLLKNKKDHSEVEKFKIKNSFFCAIRSNDIQKLELIYSCFPKLLTQKCAYKNQDVAPLVYAKKLDKQNAAIFIEEKLKAK
ncbi:hypothetical protein AAEX28_12855 [Lentisphaerota bacterium WC36G]|nr:hypothetical protein LJT99_15675 [Lentisphaerae bacterium WC36]